jgi:transposase
MKTNDNTSSTTQDHDTNAPITNDKIVTLLKLVYYENKSIKQASNYLSIKYNTAKRIIKKFRKNKIELDTKATEKQSKEEEYKKSESVVIKKLLSQINHYTNTLKHLNLEIYNNKRTLAVLGLLFRQCLSGETCN